ncbi:MULTISPECIES: hypothetical protein [unclassified Microcoleus]|uniref:hypothetical protein n=1 Tax=unclassified Microcoleus TaxID=2642155 RepID=UPI002FD68166
MPVPQRVNFLVEQASCLFIKSLLRMMQHLSLTDARAFISDIVEVLNASVRSSLKK